LQSESDLQLSHSSASFSFSQLAKIAKDLGLDVEKMKKDASSDEVQAEIDADVELARTIGINGTPAFIVEETLYPGYIGEDGMVQAIKEAREQQ